MIVISIWLTCLYKLIFMDICQPKAGLILGYYPPFQTFLEIKLKR